jgi:hypothetical protein
MTMALVVTCTSLLYMDSWMYPVGAYVAVLYLLFAAYSNDSLSYKWLWERSNGAISMWVQYPAFVAPYVFLFIYIVRVFDDTHGLVISVLCGCTAWVVDRVLCNGIPVLAFGHTVWHIAIAYASMLFICFGLRKRGIELDGAWWPVAVYLDNQVYKAN